MVFPAFTTSFTGVPVRPLGTHDHVASSLSTSRCSMGTSLAPVIKIKDTKSDQTSSVNVEMAPIAASESLAAGLLGSTALKTMLKGRPMPAVLPAAPEVCPPGTSPADFYFPAETRNTAPVITLGPDQSLSVSYDNIETVVSGTSSNSVDSVAFWKKPSYKWVSEESPSSTQVSDVIETALFEKYFPTAVRNRAPVITMKPPAGDWDTTAYITLGSEFIDVSPDLARKLSVKAGMDEPNIKASATVEKYFGGEEAYKAPLISIVPDTSVTFGFEFVPNPLEEAKAFLAERGVATV